MTTEAKILAAIDTAGGQANAASIASTVGIEAAMARQYLRTLVDKKLVREVSEPGKRIEYARAGRPAAPSKPLSGPPSPEDLLEDAKAAPEKQNRATAILAPYLPAIRVLRLEKKYSWKQIAEFLAQRGIKTNTANLSKAAQRDDKKARQ